MPKWILTVSSRSGSGKVNVVTGASTDSVTVYDETDLDERLAAAATDPRQLDVTVREEH